jgi:hypothetical protein
MNDTRQTKYIRYGHKVVGATAVQVSAISVELEKGLLLRAPGASDPAPNTAPIWVGNNNKVTADSDIETGGMPLIPGANMTIPANLVKDLWVISTTPAQDLAWMGV